MSEQLVTELRNHDHELALAEAPFQEQALRAKAIDREDLVAHFISRANLESDMLAIVTDDTMQAEDAIQKVIACITESSAYRTSPTGHRTLEDETVITFDDFLRRQDSLPWWMLRLSLKDTGIKRYSDLAKARQEADFKTYVHNRLEVRDDFADTALRFRERLAKAAEDKRANAPAQDAIRRHLLFANAVAASMNFVAAYPGTQAAITDAEVIKQLRSPTDMPIQIAPGIFSKDNLAGLSHQAHYELAAPLLLQGLNVANAQVNPWRQVKFVDTATRVSNELIKKYYGKVADFEVQQLEISDEWLAKLFAGNVTEIPPRDRVRHLLWQLTLLPTGKPPILSAVESGLYIHDPEGNRPTPTIKFLKSFKRIGANAVALRTADAIAAARFIESEALKAPLSGGLPGLGRRR